MLFDLRSRGRRRTVQGVYLGLALVLGLGLVLFGVGAGNGIGGLLNAFTGNGSGNNQGQVVSQQEQTALKAVKADPNSAAAWSQLVQARWTSAGEANNFNSATNTFTSAVKKKLVLLTQDWQRYLQLTKSPDPNVAVLAARSYAHLGNYAGASSAWAAQTSASPSQLGYECMAATAFAAGQTDKATLALDKALTYVPKAQQATIKSQVTAAKTQPAIVQQECG
jgi:tetratricopeptide (TPR) repeat protein